VLGTLVDAGFSPADAFSSVQAVGNLVIGSAIEYHAERERPSDRPDGHAPAPDARAYPHLAALAPVLAEHTAAQDHEALFRHGLDLMITGLRARLATPA
jgi:TetR/AcrR family tetracycline transcriptional repressor